MFGLLDSPKVQSYVNLVGSAVAQFAPRQVPYRFAVLNTDVIGAFAIPGGYIFITRAAMDAMKSEAELAGALGHEIIHVSERHLESGNPRAELVEVGAGGSADSDQSGSGHPPAAAGGCAVEGPLRYAPQPG